MDFDDFFGNPFTYSSYSLQSVTIDISDIKDDIMKFYACLVITAWITNKYMATQERNVTEFMQSYIYGLESCGYGPSVPEWANSRNSEKYIIMEAKENGVPISTKVVDLTIEGKFSETKKRYDADLAKQVKFLKPKSIYLGYKIDERDAYFIKKLCYNQTNYKLNIRRK